MRDYNSIGSISTLYTLYVACIFLVTSTPALAFEGDEHKNISNLALNIALNYVESKCDSETTTIKVANCRNIRDKISSLLDTNNSFNYGAINELVDYMHYPEQIFEHFNFKQRYPDNNKSLHKDHLSEHVLSLKESSKTGLALLDYLSASSRNERHFQDALMESMHYSHIDAMRDAREGYIFNALIHNSISDHYLNDFFAPGHITTTRENSHDTVALAMHDRANKAGSCFRIAGSQWDELVPILDFIRSNITTDINQRNHFYDTLITINSKYDKDFTLINNKPGYSFDDDDYNGNDDYEYVDDTKTLISNLHQCERTLPVSSNLENNLRTALQQTSVANELKTSILNSIIDSLESNHEKLYMQGDKRLKHNPVQQLFMTLVQAKSITEVFKEYVNCYQDESQNCSNNDTVTTNYFWKGSYHYDVKQKKFDIIPPEAGIKYGMYNILDDTKNKSENENIAYILDRPKYASPGIGDNIFVLAFGGQTPVSQESSRFEFQLELFPLRIGTTDQFDMLRDMTVQRPSTECTFLCNLGFSYGITHIDDDKFKSDGFQLRVIRALPKISALVSVYGRRSQYRSETSSDEKWKSTIGIRYDHGFSLHSFYIGYQRDYGYNSSDEFINDNVITFGWAISFPSSRLLGYFNSY